MSNGAASFVTQRSKLIAMYNAMSGPGGTVAYEAKTKPYKSAQQFIFPVVDAFPIGAIVMAHAVLRQQTQAEWFSYKLGDNIPFGPAGVTRTALEGDTNLSKPRQTNGVEDFVIEGISATCKSRRIDYPATSFTGTDPDDISAYAGGKVIYDPASLMSPPQMMSPNTGEDALFEALKPVCAIEFEWDRRRVEKIGTLDEIPEGGAKSFLRASGDPRTDNRYRIPEGYLWRREGQPDSEFITRGRISEAVVIPISLIGTLGSAILVKPNNLYIDVVIRLHGLALSLPSAN
jgi:hypothetical protein